MAYINTTIKSNISQVTARNYPAIVRFMRYSKVQYKLFINFLKSSFQKDSLIFLKITVFHSSELHLKFVNSDAQHQFSLFFLLIVAFVY